MIYVFDVDGVTIETPRDLVGNVVDVDFWNKHYSNRDLQLESINQEVLGLVYASYMSGDSTPVFVTGRPDEFGEITAEILEEALCRWFYWGGDHQGVRHVSIYDDPEECIDEGIIPLYTNPRQVEDWSTTTDFKIDLLKSWEDRGCNIGLIFEDHKEKADVYRAFWPVLLWERTRPNKGSV